MAQLHLLTSRGARAAALVLQKEINIVFGGPILLAPSNPAQIVGPGLGSSRRIKRLHVHSPVSPAEEEEEGGGRLAGFIARDNNGGGKKSSCSIFKLFLRHQHHNLSGSQRLH